MIGLWWAEAGRFGVLPLDDRGFPERAVKYQSHGSPRLRSRLVLYPGMARIPSGAAPLMIDRSYRIVARLSDSGVAPEGVIVSLGDLSGGFTLYVKGGQAIFEYNHEGTPYRVESRAGAVTAAARTLEFAFERAADYAGTGRFIVDGVDVGEASIPRTARWFISWSALDVGRDSLSRVSDAYADAFAFTPGALQRVEIELEPQQQPVDHQPVD
jgi:arylsulfatase